MSGSSQTVALWYVTLHGGSNDIGDNIRSYDSAGNLVSDAVLDISQVHLQELCGKATAGMAFSNDGWFYVVR